MKASGRRTAHPVLLASAGTLPGWRRAMALPAPHASVLMRRPHSVLISCPWALWGQRRMTPRSARRPTEAAHVKQLASFCSAVTCPSSSYSHPGCISSSPRVYPVAYPDLLILCHIAHLDLTIHRHRQSYSTDRPAAAYLAVLCPSVSGHAVGLAQKRLESRHSYTK